MLNVRDECDLPEDDGYDLFTRETEVERRRADHIPLPGAEAVLAGRRSRAKPSVRTNPGYGAK